MGKMQVSKTYKLVDSSIGNLLGFRDNDEVIVTNTKIQNKYVEVVSTLNKNLVGYTFKENLRENT